MESLFLPDPDEDDEAYIERIKLCLAFDDPSKQYIRCLLNKIKYGVTYSKAIEKKVKKLQEELSVFSPEKLNKLYEKAKEQVKEDREKAEEEVAELVGITKVTSEEESESEESEEEKSEESEEEESEGEESEEESTAESEGSEEPAKEEKGKQRKIKKIIEEEVPPTLSITIDRKVVFPDISDVNLLEGELTKAENVLAFKEAILDFQFGKATRILSGNALLKAKREAQSWFSRNFYLNLARGNIKNFIIEKFESKDLDSERVKIILKNPERTEIVDWTINNDSEVEFLFKKKRIGTSLRIYKILGDKYTGKEKRRGEQIFKVLLRYWALGFDNNYLSIPGKVVQYKNSFDLECFGSPFNTHIGYFGPFPEIEENFGSVGSYFSDLLPAGTATFNPPYDEEFIELAAARLLKVLKKREITVFCVLPVWDAEEREILGLPLYDPKGEKVKTIDEAAAFVGYDMLVDSEFMKEQAVWKNVSFYDFLSDSYISIGPVIVMILSSTKTKLKLEKLREIWLEGEKEKSEKEKEAPVEKSKKSGEKEKAGPSAK